MRAYFVQRGSKYFEIFEPGRTIFLKYLDRCHREIDLLGLRHPRVIFTRECGTPKPIFLRVFGIPHGIPSGNLASISHGIPSGNLASIPQGIPSGNLASIPHGIPSGNLASTNSKHVRLSNVELYVYLTLCSHMRQTANTCVCRTSSCTFILRCAVSSLEERLAAPISCCYC